MKTQILTVYYQPGVPIIEHPDYLPIQSSKAISGYDLGIQGDNTGDNISNLGAFGEYQAIYWAWKNLPHDVEIVGLCHYRRFLDFHKMGNQANWNTSLPLSMHDKINYDIPDKIKRFVAKGGIVTAKPYVMRRSVEATFCICHPCTYLWVMKGVLLDIHGSQFEPAWHRHMEMNNKFRSCNLFLMNRDNFNSFCQWIFPVLFRCNEKIVTDKSDAYQARSIAFLAERLFHLYIESHDFKLKAFPFLLLNSGMSEQEYHKPTYSEYLLRAFLNASYNIGFGLSNIFYYHEWDWLNHKLLKLLNHKNYYGEVGKIHRTR